MSIGDLVSHSDSGWISSGSRPVSVHNRNDVAPALENLPTVIGRDALASTFIRVGGLEAN
jgi:hypothetical protein